MELDGRAVFDGLVAARERPPAEAAGVDVVQLARDVLLAEQEFRRAGEYLSGGAAESEGREVGLADWAKGLGWGALAVASVTPWGTLGKLGRAARAGQDVFEVGRAVGAAEAVGDVLSPKVASFADLDFSRVFTGPTSAADLFGYSEDAASLSRPMGPVLRSDIDAGRSRFFHSTSTENVQSVLREGLRPSLWEDEVGDIGIFASTRLASPSGSGSLGGGVLEFNANDEGLVSVVEFVHDSSDVIRLPDGTGWHLVAPADFPEVAKNIVPDKIAAIHTFRRVGDGWEFVDTLPVNGSLGSVFEDYGVAAGARAAENVGDVARAVKPLVEVPSSFGTATPGMSVEDALDFFAQRRAGGVAARWDVPEGVDGLTRSVFEFQREAGVPFDEALRVVNRTRAAEGLEPVGDVVRAAEEILPPAGIPDIDNMPALRAASEELPESAGMQYLREPLPGMRGAVSAEDMPAMRQAIREWRSRSSESALENPEFVNRVAQVLMDEADVRALALSYARMAPAGMAKNLDLRTAVLPRTLEAFANAEDAARGARPVISGGRPVSPLTQMNIIPSNAVAPHFEPYFYAARYVANPSKERLRQFAESLMRTHHNLYQGLDKGGRVGDIWYMERADKAQNVASSIRTDAGEQAFDRIVVAFAMAGFSAGAPPILEPVRAIPSMPFLRAVGDDKVIFDVEAFSRVFPNLAAPKVVNGETVYEGGYNFWGAIAAAAAMTNPDVANQRVAGIAAKTFPYFVVTVDPLNPWGVVADRNFIYAASGHTLGGEYVTASGKTVKIAKPSTTEGAPLQAYRGILTAISRGIERVPSAGQEMDWFEPRLWLQHAVGESFVMGRGVSDARAQMLTAQPEMANIFPSDVEQSWDELVRYAFESAGSHPLVGGEANAKKVREIAARNRQKFIERVRSGQAPEWTMVGDQPIIRRDRWDLTMPIQVRLQPKSVKKVKESGLTVAELVASGEKIDETKFIRVGRQFMEDNETILGGFLRSLYQRDPRAAFSIIALLLPAAAVTGANIGNGEMAYNA